MENLNDQNTSPPVKMKAKLNKQIFIPTAIALVLVILWGAIDLVSFEAGTNAVVAWIKETLNGPILLLVAFMFIFLVVMTLTPFGKIKLGGPDAKPQFSFFSWFAMTLTGGIGTGIMFWCVAEPMNFTYLPPEHMGLEPGTPDAAIWAMSKVFLHWTYHPYAIYSIFAIAIGYFAYNKGLPMRPSSALYPVIGDKIYGAPGKVVDSLTIFAVVCGIATACSYGVQSLGAGLDYLFGITPSPMTYVITIIIIMCCYCASSYSGIARGIKILSSINVWAYLFLLIFIFICGQKIFCIELGVESFGVFFDGIIGDSLITDPFNNEANWFADWTGFYWAWWWPLAPIVGIFFARVAKGRTVRALVWMNLLVTGTYGAIWMVVFGGNGLYLQMTGKAPLWDIISEQGNEVALIQFLNEFPMGTLLVVVAMFCVFIGYVTHADSVTSSLAILSSDMDMDETLNKEPPAYVKLTWGIIMGGIAIIVNLIGSAGAVQTGSIICAVPLEIITAIILVALIFEMLSKDAKRQIDESVKALEAEKVDYKDRWEKKAAKKAAAGQTE